MILLKFRQAYIADIPQLIDMRIAYLKEDYNGLTAEQTRTITSQLQDYFKKLLNQDFFAFVCEENEVIVSTVFLVIFEKPANPSFLTGLTGTILNVYTLPQYRKRGIASTLIKMALEHAKQKKLSYVDLKATQAGYSLYSKLGFIPDRPKNVPMIYHISQDMI